MPHEEPWLFDLPLVQGEDGPDDDPAVDESPRPPAPRRPEPSAEVRSPRPAGAGELPLFPAGEQAPDDEPFRDEAEEGAYSDLPATGREAVLDGRPSGEAGRPVPAPWSTRVLAALADGAFLGAAVVGGGLIAVALGTSPGRDALLPLALFALAFSFVYSVVPLAFWGHTPGMATAGLVARDDDGGPLTFGQTGLRWLGGLLTLACAGLPLLLALGVFGGRSLADRLSGTRTWRRGPAG